MGSISDWLRQVLPAGCGVALAPIGDPAPGIYPDEEALVASAVAKRRREFRAGRVAARTALAQAGSAPGAILARKEGDPLWPVGFIASISHTDDIAAAIAAPASMLQALGLDIEPDSRLADDDLAGLICRPEEAAVEPMLSARGIDTVKLRFVAKEAYYKAVYPCYRRFIDFQDVRVIFFTESDRFAVEIPDARLAGLLPETAEMHGYFKHAGGCLIAVAYFDRLPVAL